MEDELKMLKQVESSLFDKLKGEPLFIKLESVRATIATFEQGEQKKEKPKSPALVAAQELIAKINGTILNKVKVPPTYLPNDLTWKQKVIYVIDKLGNPGVAAIINELLKLENTTDKKFITKRASVTLTQLKTGHKIGAKLVDKKSRYYIDKEI